MTKLGLATVVAAGIALLGAVPEAGAATWDFTYTGPGIDMSGVLTTSDTVDPNALTYLEATEEASPIAGNSVFGPDLDGYDITAISGTRNGVSIDSLFGTAGQLQWETSTSPNYIFDNMLYQIPNTPVVDVLGLEYVAGGQYFNVYYNGSGYEENLTDLYNLTITPVAADPPNPNGITPEVPEPATWAMMLVGFAFVGFVLRRRGSVAGRAVRA